MDKQNTLIFIQKAHEGQYDKSGAPYWKHPWEVCRIVGEFFSDSSETDEIVALLHDVVEDTEYTYEDLRTMGYTEEVIEALKLITRDKESGLTYIEWIRKIADSGNKAAVKVKIADNLHNMNIDRILNLPKESRGIIKRYVRSLKILIDKVDL